MLNNIDPRQHYAYPEEFKELEAVMRFSAVKRWHMVETRKAQTLAEHSANVAALAFLVATRCPLMYFGPGNGVISAALFHDMPEVFTGDIPTPSKRWLDKNRLDQAEHTITPRIFMIPVSDNERLMIKICDLADSIRHIRTHAVDLTGHHAQAGLEMQMRQRLQSANAHWPLEVYNHVLETIWFYTYETTRNGAAPWAEPVHGGKVEAFMARGQGDQSGDSGSVVCDDRRQL